MVATALSFIHSFIHYDDDDDYYYCYYYYYPRLHSRQRGYGVQLRLSVCLFVRALKGKRLKLSKPNLAHVYSMAVAQNALTQRSKGQRSRSRGYENRTVARLLLTIAARLYCILCAGVGLHIDTTTYVF